MISSRSRHCSQRNRSGRASLPQPMQRSCDVPRSVGIAGLAIALNFDGNLFGRRKRSIAFAIGKGTVFSRADIKPKESNGTTESRALPKTLTDCFRLLTRIAEWVLRPHERHLRR